MNGGWLDDRVNEGGEGGGLCEDQHEAEHDQNEYQRKQPPFFPDAHELPELAEYLQLAHGWSLMEAMGSDQCVPRLPLLLQESSLCELFEKK